MMAHRNTI